MNDELKNKVYETLRSADIEKTLSLLQNSEITEYMSLLQNDNAIQQHILRLLDGKLDAGKKKTLCEISSILWPHGIKMLPVSMNLCRDVAKVINIDRNLMLYQYTDIAQKIKKLGKIPSAIMGIILEYAHDESLPLTKSDLTYITNEEHCIKDLLSRNVLM